VNRSVRRHERLEHLLRRVRRLQSICERVAGVVESTAAKAMRPSSLVVEFGLKFSANGTVIVAGASGEASLKMTVSYDSSRQG